MTKIRALKKEILLPGVQLEIRSDIPLTDGLGGSSALMLGAGTGKPSGSIPWVSAHALSSYAPKELPTPGFKLFPGDVCTVVHGPKKVGCANVARVQNDQGVEGYVFWCELKANAKLYEPTPASSVSTQKKPSM